METLDRKTVPVSDINDVECQSHKINGYGLMEDGSLEALSKSIEKYEDHVHRYEIQVQYKNLTFWNMMTKKTISTVGSSIIGMVVGGKKGRVNILNDLTGRILPKRMTLVIGPPGSGECTTVDTLLPLFYLNFNRQDYLPEGSGGSTGRGKCSSRGKHSVQRRCD